MQKRTLLRILFILTFIPYILILINVVALANNIDISLWILPTNVSINTFWDALIWVGAMICYYSSMPLCIIYQMVYIVGVIRNKRNNMRKM